MTALVFVIIYLGWIGQCLITAARDERRKAARR